VVATRRSPLLVQNLRVNNVEIPNSKRIQYSLQYIFGIGDTSAQLILKNSGVENKKTYELNEEEINKIREEVQKYTTEADLLLHILSGPLQGLPVRGQRTKTNARTRKGKVKTVAGKVRGLRLGEFMQQSDLLHAALWAEHKREDAKESVARLGLWHSRAHDFIRKEDAARKIQGRWRLHTQGVRVGGVALMPSHTCMAGVTACLVQRQRQQPTSAATPTHHWVPGQRPVAPGPCSPASPAPQAPDTPHTHAHPRSAHGPQPSRLGELEGVRSCPSSRHRSHTAASLTHAVDGVYTSHPPSRSHSRSNLRHAVPQPVPPLLSSAAATLHSPLPGTAEAAQGLLRPELAVSCKSGLLGGSNVRVQFMDADAVLTPRGATRGNPCKGHLGQPTLLVGGSLWQQQVPGQGGQVQARHQAGCEKEQEVEVLEGQGQGQRQGQGQLRSGVEKQQSDSERPVTDSYHTEPQLPGFQPHGQLDSHQELHHQQQRQLQQLLWQDHEHALASLAPPVLPLTPRQGSSSADSDSQAWRAEEGVLSEGPLLTGLAPARVQMQPAMAGDELPAGQDEHMLRAASLLTHSQSAPPGPNDSCGRQALNLAPLAVPDSLQCSDSSTPSHPTSTTHPTEVLCMPPIRQSDPGSRRPRHLQTSRRPCQSPLPWQRGHSSELSHGPDPDMPSTCPSQLGGGAGRATCPQFPALLHSCTSALTQGPGPPLSRLPPPLCRTLQTVDSSSWFDVGVGLGGGSGGSSAADRARAGARRQVASPVPRLPHSLTRMQLLHQAHVATAAVAGGRVEAGGKVAVRGGGSNSGSWGMGCLEGRLTPLLAPSPTPSCALSLTRTSPAHEGSLLRHCCSPTARQPATKPWDVQGQRPQTAMHCDSLTQPTASPYTSLGPTPPIWPPAAEAAGRGSGGDGGGGGEGEATLWRASRHTRQQASMAPGAPLTWPTTRTHVLHAAPGGNPT
ncbi:hypothetical protein QJQ45_026355, partial [Haematococcus lacustris]